MSPASVGTKPVIQAVSLGYAFRKHLLPTIPPDDR